MMLVIGLIGLGNVGKSVVTLLEHKAESIRRRTGRDVRIKTICVRNVEKKREIDEKKYKVTADVQDILNDPEINLIVEVMGGEKPALDMICDALKKKKYVVTANKEVLCKHKTKIFKLAKDNQVDIYFEAAVGGGIPLIRSLKIGYAANRIEELVGILNGTTNYILTRIEEEGRDYADVLKEAQRLGFAEADPTMDVSGLDAAHKLVILAAVAFKADVNLTDIYYEGIENISLKDLRYAKEFGTTIKLLAIGRHLEDDQMIFKIHPTMIPLSHPLATVRNELNAAFIVGDFVGESMLSGKGAGGFPTASAIVSDIIDIAFDYGMPTRRNLEDQLSKFPIVPISETHSEFYVRFLTEDTYGVLEKITGVFGQNKVSISKIVQKDVVNNEAEIVIVTHRVKEADFQSALHSLQKLSTVKKICSVIRVGLS